MDTSRSNPAFIGRRLHSIYNLSFNSRGRLSINSSHRKEGQRSHPEPLGDSYDTRLADPPVKTLIHEDRITCLGSMNRFGRASRRGLDAPTCLSVSPGLRLTYLIPACSDRAGKEPVKVDDPEPLAYSLPCLRSGVKARYSTKQGLSTDEGRRGNSLLAPTSLRPGPAPVIPTRHPTGGYSRAVGAD